MIADGGEAIADTVLRSQPELFGSVASDETAWRVLAGAGGRAPQSSCGLARLRAVFDIGVAQPLLQGHRVNTEVCGDLLDRHSGFTVARDAHDIVT